MAFQEAGIDEQCHPPGFVRAAALLSPVPERHITGPLLSSPDPRLVARIGAQRCLSLGLVPLGRIGGQTLVAASRPAEWVDRLPELTAALGPVRLSLAGPELVENTVTAHFRNELRLLAEERVPVALSLRSWPDAIRAARLPIWGAGALVTLMLWPQLVFTLILGWLVLTLLAISALRLGALLHAWRSSRAAPGSSAELHPLHLPVVSILVPLFRESDIAPRLVQRLGQLDYPRERLDILIVLEEKDRSTLIALEAAGLPRWMRIVVVPDGPITTKPRAMNYALDFCRGSIIGIYDAEDAPDTDQIRKVVARFAARGPEVACLQGALDYYNPRSNMIARLFTAEYASWFRVVMPMLEHLRLPMPLGGTTLFIRREALEQVGAWDAHNVTEDADLGIRLARFGLRTEMLDTTTSEEANCRPRAWIVQRSRWIKGHLLTWATHMRSPRALLRELGWRGFFGYQLVFLGAQSQVILAPVMWSFWLILAGLPHPAQDLLRPVTITALVVLFVASELLVMATALVGLSRTRHRGLLPCVPLLHFYHPFGAIAGWRAVWESIRDPFYWAKTSHGHFDSPTPEILLPERESESAAARIADTLEKPAIMAAEGQRVRTSPASIFNRVSKAREIWVRSASQAASPSRPPMASMIAACSASATESRPSAASEVEASKAIER